MYCTLYSLLNLVLPHIVVIGMLGRCVVMDTRVWGSCVVVGISYHNWYTGMCGRCTVVDTGVRGRYVVVGTLWLCWVFGHWKEAGIRSFCLRRGGLMSHRLSRADKSSYSSSSYLDSWENWGELVSYHLCFSYACARMTYRIFPLTCLFLPFLLLTLKPEC